MSQEVKSKRIPVKSVNIPVRIPDCDLCGSIQKELGAVFYGPPTNKRMMVKKLHCCRHCWREITRHLNRWEKRRIWNFITSLPGMSIPRAIYPEFISKKLITVREKNVQDLKTLIIKEKQKSTNRLV